MDDLLNIDVQDMQQAEYQLVMNAMQGQQKLMLSGYTISLDNVPLLCAGMHAMWHGHSMAWSFVSRDIGVNLYGATRAIRRHLIGKMEYGDTRRISMSVRTGWEDGARWAAMLGFKRECTMRNYGPHGHDYDLWAMVTP